MSNTTARAPRAISRDEVGKYSKVQEPLLEGSVEVTLKDGKKVACRPVFDVVKEYLAHFDPKTTEEITWAPAASVEQLQSTPEIGPVLAQSVREWLDEPRNRALVERLRAAGAAATVFAAWKELVAAEILPEGDEDEFATGDDENE
mgnify:CR=1 FL=1